MRRGGPEGTAPLAVNRFLCCSLLAAALGEHGAHHEHAVPRGCPYSSSYKAPASSNPG